MSGLDLEPEQAAVLIRIEPELRLLDVREPAEYEVARIEGGRLATVEFVREVLDEWPRETPILVYCHHGVRSLFFALRLARAGFTNVRNLRGGIEAWSARVDPSIPRYTIRYGEGIVTVPQHPPI